VGKGLARSRHIQLSRRGAAPIDPLNPQAAAACLNAGDVGLNPAIAGNSSPPLAGNVGSGKFGIPCSRMHRTCASTAARCEPLMGLPVDVPVAPASDTFATRFERPGTVLNSGRERTPWIGEVGVTVACVRTPRT